MKTLKTMKPGTKGTARFVREWGDNLVAVRYREDAQCNKIFTTIEVIVDERERTSRPMHRHQQFANQRLAVVAVSVQYQEADLRQKLKNHGARWSQQLKLWLIRYEHVVALGIRERIVAGAAEKCLDVDTSLVEIGGRI